MPAAHHQEEIMSGRGVRWCMHTVSVRRTIGASASDVWAVLDDFGGVAKYNPRVASSSIVDGPQTGTGATRACSFTDGGRVEERIVEYDPGERYVVEFVDLGDVPLKRNVVEVAVEPTAESEATVEMTTTFAPKYGPLGWLLAKLVMASKFEETFEDVLRGLESYVVEAAEETRADTASD